MHIPRQRVLTSYSWKILKWFNLDH